MGIERRKKREKERFMIKIHNEFQERIKGMTEDQIKEYVNKQVQKYSYLNGSNNQPNEEAVDML
jgi:hypothetical protein